jgi:hypothetical protein
MCSECTNNVCYNALWMLQVAAPVKAVAGPSRFAAYDSDSEESDDGNRVARSVKERTWDKLLSIIKVVHNNLKINNWVALQEEFDKLNSTLDKSFAVVMKEGLPRFYIKTLVVLEDAVNAVSRADSKKMSQVNAKALTRVKMTLKKNNEKYAAPIEAYRKAPDADDAIEVTAGAGRARADTSSDDDDSSGDEVVIGRAGVTVQKSGPVRKHTEATTDSEESDSSESEEETKPAGKADQWKKKAPAKGKGEGDEDGSSWEGGEDSSSSSEEEETRPRGREYWLKRTTVVKKEGRKDANKPGKQAAAVSDNPWSKFSVLHCLTVCLSAETSGFCQRHGLTRCDRRFGP